MTVPRAKLRRASLLIALLLLLGLAWTGLHGGFNLLGPSHTPGQKVQAVAQIAFGLFGLLSAITTFRARRWRPLALACFTISLTFATGLFAAVWSHMTLDMGVLASGIALLVALGIVRLLRTAQV